jgi:hypothetical protein
MTHFRDFSSSDEFQQPIRNIDSDAPTAMRHELIDLFFHLAEHNFPQLSDERLCRIISQSLGKRAPGQPYGGYRSAAGRDLEKAEWPRVYDLICRLWPEFEKVGIGGEYHQGINRILSGNRVVWELDRAGQLHRVLPPQFQTFLATSFAELSNPRFAAALELFNAALDAFDYRPRRDRDACSNIFDCMESVAKEVFSMPNATFGEILKNIRQNQSFKSEIIGVLDAINTLRNRKFGHGMTITFDLSQNEIDFTFITCIGGILSFART